MKHFTEIDDFDIYRLFVKQGVKKGAVEYINAAVYLEIEEMEQNYTWQMCIENEHYYGRSWEEFTRFVKVISHCLRLYDKRRLIFYVNNLDAVQQCTGEYFTGIEFQAKGQGTVNEPLHDIV